MSQVNLELQSPSEIDLQWEPLDGKLSAILDRLSSYKRQAEEYRAKGSERDLRYAADMDRYYESYKAFSAAERASLKAQIAPLQAEWERRGGWQRYWLCASDGGHVHYRQCHTLRWNSRIAWMPMLSGLDEAGMVEKVGFKACTHCFPSAPLSPFWARSEAEYKRKSADEKLAKWEKGRQMRQKKVDNIRKRLGRARAKLEGVKVQVNAGKMNSNEAIYQRIGAEYDIRDAERELPWAEREVERWLGKKPA